MRVAFWDNQLCERGTSVAVFDYAFYNKYLLGNESIIFYEKKNVYNVNKVITKFENTFPDDVYGVFSISEADEILEKKGGCDCFYIIGYGVNNGMRSRFKTVIHCVFDCRQPHGDVYAAISSFLTGYHSGIPIVPHMVNLPDHDKNMRFELGIPSDAVVFGRHGGYEQFDIRYVHEVVEKIASVHTNIYFVFVNTRRFHSKSYKNIIYIDKCIVDLEEKVRFINTCDAMLWARSDGETFGLAIAEFSTRNKPIIATKTGSLAHVHFLGKRAFWYHDADSLLNILTAFDPKITEKEDWNVYREYTPEKVMSIFKSTFLT